VGFSQDRNSFRQALAEAIAASGERNNLAAVLVQLDAFHKINERYGYDIGDEVLKVAFAALESSLSGSIRLHRAGGTRFAFVVPTVKYPALLNIGIQRALAAVAGPHDVAGTSISINAVAGAALFPESADSADQLFLNAELALQSADAEDNPVSIYTHVEHKPHQDRWQLEFDLRHALEECQLEVHYQPQIRLEDFSPLGFEALTRWRHPTQGVIPPDVFIPVAERSSLIHELTEWVMHTSLRHIAGLQRPDRKPHVSVNVSPVTLFDPGFPYAIESALSLWGGSHDQLVLEVTEGTLVYDTEGSKRVLDKLRDKGVRVAIDDFGTGYASLSYIKQLAVDEIKIDKSFIINIANDDVDRKLVESIIDVGHKLDLGVIAEGVEDERALHLLRELGCDAAQGFLIAHALDASEIPAWYDGTLPFGKA